MSTVKKVAGNSLVIFIGNIIERIIGFFVTLILIRYLGSGNFGKYSLIYAFLSFFDIFTNMGIDSIITRELSKDYKKGAELMGNAITLKLLLSLTGIILCWSILQWMHYPAEIKLLIYLASLSMVFSFGTLFNNIFQVKLLMKYPTLIAIIMKILFAVSTIILIFLKAGLFYFILMNLLIYIIQVIFIYYQSRKFLHIRVAMDLGIWKELLKDSWPLAISTIFAVIYTRIDQIMLFSMKGKDALGFYAAAVKLAELPIILAGVFMASVIPLLFKYAKTSPELFKRTYEISFKYLMIFIIPIAMIATLYSRQIILACYGQSFLPSGVAMAILIWATIFVFGGLVHSNLLLATDIQHFDIIFTGFSLVLNIFLNLILIPKYSFRGAAIATAISYGLGLPLSYALKRTRRFAKAMVKSMIKPLLAALFAGYLVYFLSSLDLIFNLILIGFIYLFLILLMRALDSEDIRYGKEILSNLLVMRFLKTSQIRSENY